MEKPNYTEEWIANLRLALDYLNADGVEERHRRTLKRAVEAALLLAIEEQVKHLSNLNEGKKWRGDELTALETELGKRGYAASYQEQQDVLDTMAARLQRAPASIKRKAVELGLGDRVDHWLAKARHNLPG